MTGSTERARFYGVTTATVTAKVNVMRAIQLPGHSRIVKRDSMSERKLKPFLLVTSTSGVCFVWGVFFCYFFLRNNEQM
jgi:hypothetical protein